MKERPILFSGAMVRAILEGRKTVTRRVVKPSLVDRFDPPRGQADVDAGYPFVEFDDGYVSAVKICPYGQPGDRLWVRETFGYVSPDEYERALDECNIEYRADLPPGCTDRPGQWPADECIGDPDRPRWRPSIHMPRRASRILLEITAVRVERLQDISYQQALDEGVRDAGEGFFDVEDSRHLAADPRESFASLWESINGAESWDANPWVWVVEFKRVTP